VSEDDDDQLEQGFTLSLQAFSYQRKDAGVVAYEAVTKFLESETISTQILNENQSHLWQILKVQSLLFAKQIK
jgi:hypothetical protein